MKPLFTTLLFCLYLSAPAQNNWKDMGLRGKVKAVQTLQTYRYKKDGKNFTPWEKTYARTYAFDKTGLYTLYEEKKVDGSSGYKVVYTNKIKEKKIEQAYFNKDGNPTIIKTLILDDKGRIIEQLEYTKDGKLDYSYKYTYDNKGNRTTLTSILTNGDIDSRTIYTYDAKNQRIGQKVETPGYEDSSIEWKYDENGNAIEETWLNGRNETVLRFKRTFDDKGNKITESKYNNGVQFLGTSTWTYEYDKQGNWTKRTEYTYEEEEFNIEERVISYY